MRHGASFIVSALAVVCTMLAAGCGTSTVEPAGLIFSVSSSEVIGSSPQILRVVGALTNNTSTVFRSGGCQRPDIAIDSATANGWVPLGAKQEAELVLCVQAFNVTPGNTQQFQSTFVRSDTAWRFPRGVPLRLRALTITGDDGPTAAIVLPR
jgi:hypothetical protein